MAKRRSKGVSSRGARALELLAGTWRTDGRLVGAPSGKRSTLTAVDRYEWLPGVKLLAHFVSGRLGRTSVASFEVWRYEPRSGAYRSTSFDDSGVSEFEARLTGREWRIRGKSQRFRGEFTRDGQTLSGTWEQKTRGSWTPWLDITLHKTSS